MISTNRRLRPALSFPKDLFLLTNIILLPVATIGFVPVRFVKKLSLATGARGNMRLSVASRRDPLKKPLQSSCRSSSRARRGHCLQLVLASKSCRFLHRCLLSRINCKNEHISTSIASIPGRRSPQQWYSLSCQY